MLSEISSAHPIIFTIVWQTGLFIAAGLMASYFCKHHPARAHQVLLLSMIAAIAVPFITIAVKHMGLGIFIANPEPVVESIAVSEGSAQPYDGLLPDSVQSAAIELEEHFIPTVAVEPEKNELHVIDLLLVGWTAASVIFLARLMLTFIMGMRVVKKAQPFEYPVFEKSIKAASSKLGIKETVTVYSSKSVSSPVIWCWKRSPILLFPSGKRFLTEKMDLVGILCHELAHLKRRDHVAGLLSELMVVFLPWHPLLWLAKKRLSSLSEHACDDWVMAAGGNGTNYAESLLDLVPVKQMAFVPSVVQNKNVLKRRVLRILRGKYGNPRLSKKRILSAVLITSCVSLMVACAQTRSSSPEQYPSREASHEMAANNNPGFEDATIEAGTPDEPAYRNVSIQLASAGPEERGSILFNPAIGGLQIRKQTLRFVIAEAYDVNEAQVVGRDWDNEPRYNITADGLKASASASGSEFTTPSEMYGPALRELLAEEFGLVTSLEQKQLEGYALLVGDGEPKLTVSDANARNHLFNMSSEGLRVTSLSLSEVAKFLTNLLGGLVVDQTGLQENYDFEVRLPMPMSPDTSPDPAAIAEALEQQLGLKIEARKLDVDVVNIVNLKPSAEVVTASPSASDKTAESDRTTYSPHPGTEAALRRHLEGLVKKQPVTEEMAPGLVEAIEQQWPQLQGAFESYGALKSITFKGKEYDNDVYHVEFEHAATTWTIGPLIDGKVSTLFFAPAVNRDGNEPSPGLREAIRRELEGSLAGEPAYEIMSPALQAATREQWLMISADAERLGAVQAITFQNVNSRGWDVYHVTFANGTATVMAEPLTDGKLNGLLHTDITVNHDGNGPSPGLSDAIRRESEGSLAEAPAYRNVSIQLASAEPGERGTIMFNPATGGLQIRKQTLRFVIGEAYGVNEAQVVGRDWDKEPHYNITVTGLKASGSTSGSEFAEPSAMYGAALCEFLAEEFGLVTSSEQGRLDGYVLLVGDGEPKLEVSAAGTRNHLFNMSPEGIRVTSLPLSEVAKFLTNLLGGLVVDQTGLQDNYDFEVKLPMPMSADTAPDPAALTEALEQQLGLKVEAKKLNVEVVNIVDLKPPAEVVTAPLSASVQMPAPPPALEELREIPHHFRFQLGPEPTEEVDVPPMLAGSGPPPPPQYPLAAARNNIEGRVVLRFVVDTDGEVKNPEVVEADPEGVFEKSMLANIEEFEFEPATLDGEPVPCLMKYTIGFELD